MTERQTIPWALPSKIKGESMIYPYTPRDPEFHQVLKEQSAEETKKYGRKVSPETILITMTLFPSTYTKVIGVRMKERYRELKKEMRSEKKYLDGIKTKRTN